MGLSKYRYKYPNTLGTLSRQPLSCESEVTVLPGIWRTILPSVFLQLYLSRCWFPVEDALSLYEALTSRITGTLTLSV